MNTTESSLREHPVFPDVNYDVPKHTTDFQQHFQPMGNSHLMGLFWKTLSS